jgi:hypothetical protein
MKPAGSQHIALSAVLLAAKADQLDECDLVRRRQSLDLIARSPWASIIEYSPQSCEAEMIGMGFLATWRTGAGIAGLVEVANGLLEAVLQRFRPIALFQPCPVRRDVAGGPVLDHPVRGVGIVTNKKKALGNRGDTRPLEGWRNVLTIAGVLPRDLAARRKGGALEY